MHHKYAKDGLAMVSVNIDDISEKEPREKVLKFLQDKKATFTNLVLDPKTSPEKLTKPLDVNGYPTTFVYDRAGKLQKRFEGPAHKEIEKLVIELLKK